VVSAVAGDDGVGRAKDVRAEDSRATTSREHKNYEARGSVDHSRFADRERVTGYCKQTVKICDPFFGLVVPRKRTVPEEPIFVHFSPMIAASFE
jgi:hypothetical protein